MSVDESVAIIRDRLRSVVIVRTNDGVGSGFYVSSAGVIVTNRHVIGPYNKLAIQRYDRTKLEARVVRVARRYDLALLIDESPEPPPALPLGDAGPLAPGEAVFAIGHPVGLEWTVTRGILSANNRLMQDAYHLQTDAVLHPGSSGGPLLDAQGHVVGVSTFGLRADGLNFALSVRYVRELLGEFIIKPAPTTHLCPQCGVRNSASRRKCRKCGASFEPVVPVADPGDPEPAPAPAPVPVPASSTLLSALDPAPLQLSPDPLQFTWRNCTVRVVSRPDELVISVSAVAGESSHLPVTLDASVPADVDARRFAAAVGALVEARERLAATW